jgi:hypothetical protein
MSSRSYSVSSCSAIFFSAPVGAAGKQSENLGGHPRLEHDVLVARQPVAFTAPPTSVLVGERLLLGQFERLRRPPDLEACRSRKSSWLGWCGHLLSPNRVSNRARPVAVRSDELARSAPGDGRRGLVPMRR